MISFFFYQTIYINKEIYDSCNSQYSKCGSGILDVLKKNLNLLILLPKGDMGYKLKYKILGLKFPFLSFCAVKYLLLIHIQIIRTY